MTTNNNFDPNAPALEGSGIYGLPHLPEDAEVVLIPVPWDATTSYRRGTAKGPEAILTASAQVDLFDIETGRPYEVGIAMLEESSQVRAWNEEARTAAEPIIDAGGFIEGKPELVRSLSLVNELGGRLNEWVYAETKRLLLQGKTVGVVGGDHAVPFGAIQAVAEKHPGLGILHIDAHADLRVAFEGFEWSHASIMYNVIRHVPEVARLVQVGIRDLGSDEYDLIQGSSGRIVTHFDAQLKSGQCAGETWAVQCERIIKGLPREVYLSFDIDGLDPALCPNTGTPVPGGLSYEQANYLIGAVVRSGRRIVGFDLNEVAPGPDGDEWDANVGARMLYKMIGWSLSSRKAPTIS